MQTILHFRGQLLSPGSYDQLIEQVLPFAEERGWPALLFGLRPEPESCERLPQGWSSPIQGIYLLPDSLCDPLTLEFDAGLHLQGSCNTSLAAPAVHRQLLDLFSRIRPLFGFLELREESRVTKPELRDKRILLVQQTGETFLPFGRSG